MNQLKTLKELNVGDFVLMPRNDRTLSRLTGPGIDNVVLEVKRKSSSSIWAKPIDGDRLTWAVMSAGGGDCVRIDLCYGKVVGASESGFAIYAEPATQADIAVYREQKAERKAWLAALERFGNAKRKRIDEMGLNATQLSILADAWERLQELSKTGLR